MTTARVVVAMITLALLKAVAARAQGAPAAVAKRDNSFGGYLHVGSVCAPVTVAGFEAGDSVLGGQVKEHLRTLLGPNTCSPTSYAFVTIMSGYTAGVFTAIFVTWHDDAEHIWLARARLGRSPVVGGMQNVRAGDAATVALEALTAFRQNFEQVPR